MTIMDSAAQHLIVNHHDHGNEHQENPEETKIFSDISIQTGDPAIKMVRFNVEHEPLHTSRKKKSKYKVSRKITACCKGIFQGKYMSLIQNKEVG